MCFMRYSGIPNIWGTTYSEVLRFTLKYPGTDAGYLYALARYLVGVLAVYLILLL